jgi:hypothetical protein
MNDDAEQPATPNRSTMAPELAAAFVAAVGELDNVSKARTANTGSYSYSYADLGDVLAACRHVLARHDLALSQDVACEVLGGGVVVSVATTVVHASGVVHRSLPLSVTSSPDAQRIGT